MRSLQRGRQSVSSKGSGSVKRGARRPRSRGTPERQGYHARMSGMKRSGYTTDPRARAFTQAQCVDYLLVYGWLSELRRGDGDRARADAQATLERWIVAGLPVAHGADGTRRFDPAEVMNFGKWLGRDGADRVLPRALRDALPRTGALVPSGADADGGTPLARDAATAPVRRHARARVRTGARAGGFAHVAADAAAARGCDVPRPRTRMQRLAGCGCRIHACDRSHRRAVRGDSGVDPRSRSPCARRSPRIPAFPIRRRCR